MAEVALHNVVKRYDDVEAVRSISLDIPDNEFVVLVGPSGCGKSTTLRMIAGLEEITSGEISIGGEVVNDLPPKDRDIAMVFQNYALYPHMTAFENMSFGLKLRKFSKEEIKQRVELAARILDITELLDRRPKALSGGQRQRVAIAMAIADAPDLLIADEPTTALDVTTQAQILDLLRELVRTEGMALLLITHDLAVIAGVADRVAVMQSGRASVTHYELVEAFRSMSLLEIHLETGRTHQIRVHFSALHHPCVGDPLYGSDPKLAKKLGLDRQWLHARTLGFDHPADGRRVEAVVFLSDVAHPQWAGALSLERQAELIAGHPRQRNQRARDLAGPQPSLNVRLFEALGCAPCDDDLGRGQVGRRLGHARGSGQRGCRGGAIAELGRERPPRPLAGAVRLNVTG